MAIYVFIGDEVTAAGFRLAGAEVQVAPPEAGADLFRRLGETAELLIVTAETAAHIPDELLRRATDEGHPLVLVVPDASGRQRPRDLAATLRTQLGMTE